MYGAWRAGACKNHTAKSGCATGAFSRVELARTFGRILTRARFTRNTATHALLRESARRGRRQRRRPDGLGPQAARSWESYFYRSARPLGPCADRLQQGTPCPGAWTRRRIALGICSRRDWARGEAAKGESRPHFGRSGNYCHRVAHFEHGEDAAVRG